MSFLINIITLAIMEVSLSFDNAIVNAGVLRRMSTKMQAIFLTWGIFIAVFVVRLVLPVVIVSGSSGMQPWDIIKLALSDPESYAASIVSVHKQIASFGGAFLLMVFLSFVCDAEKDIHWIQSIEKKLAELGAGDGIQIAFTLLTALLFKASLPATIIGIIIYVSIKAIGEITSTSHAAIAGIGGFIYLETLDASFSLDGIVAAFAVSSDIITIMAGLGIGAFAIRYLTVLLVRNNTLNELRYLAHGAHWGIGALGLLLFLSTRIEIPEGFTAVVAVTIIATSFISSLGYKEVK